MTRIVSHLSGKHMRSQMAVSLPLAGSKVLCLRNTAEMCNNSAGICIMCILPPDWGWGPSSDGRGGKFWALSLSLQGDKCSPPAELRSASRACRLHSEAPVLLGSVWMRFLILSGPLQDYSLARVWWGADGREPAGPWQVKMEGCQSPWAVLSGIAGPFICLYRRAGCLVCRQLGHWELTLVNLKGL